MKNKFLFLVFALILTTPIAVIATVPSTQAAVAPHSSGRGDFWCFHQGNETSLCMATIGSYFDNWLARKWNTDWDKCWQGDMSACNNAFSYFRWSGDTKTGEKSMNYEFSWVGPCINKELVIPKPQKGYCIWDNYAVIINGGATGPESWEYAFIANTKVSWCGAGLGFV